MKKAIITGCTGCIGVALINELVANGVEVTAVIRENSSRKDAIPCGVNIIECSLDNIRELPRLLPHDYHVRFPQGVLYDYKLDLVSHWSRYRLDYGEARYPRPV